MKPSRHFVHAIAAVLYGAFGVSAPASALALLAVDEVAGGGNEIVSFSPTLSRGGFQSVANPITGFAADATGRYIATGALVTQYNSAGAALGSVSGAHGVIYSSLYTYGGILFAASQLNGAINALGAFQESALKGERLFDFTTASKITGVAADASGIYLASGRLIGRYDNSGNILDSVSGATGVIYSSLVIHAGDLFAASQLNGAINALGAFQASALKGGKLFDFTTASKITGVAVDSDGIYLAEGNSISLYDFGGNIIGSYTGGASDNFGALAFEPSVSAPAPRPHSVAVLGLLLAAVCFKRRRRTNQPHDSEA